MKNITISVDEELAQRLRVAAAHAGQSLSRYLVEAGKRRMDGEEAGTPRRNRQKEALEHIRAGPMWDVSENGRMPNADERNARR